MYHPFIIAEFCVPASGCIWI